MRFFLYVLLAFCPINQVFALENLYLSGYVRSFERSQGIISVYVTTPNCEGLRQFLYPQDAKDDLEPSLIGKRIDFFINSSTCERGKVYQMIFR
ncbi:MAG: hypothetical protein N2513_06515 [Deltaproteobacteria bacterium]|nr:hypothetical protein [Deltaproteobacteria bacterium]